MPDNTYADGIEDAARECDRLADFFAEQARVARRRIDYELKSNCEAKSDGYERAAEAIRALLKEAPR